MGKRKERRLAAMKAAGRRVKLDLFADPSGEMVDKSLQGEVGRNLNDDDQTGVPTSPSSSGQKEENPLLLLGQYSDDELDEEAVEQPNGAVKEISTDPDGKVEESADVGGSVSSNVNEAPASTVPEEPAQMDTIEKLNGGDVKENNATSTETQQNEYDKSTQDFPDASGMQIIGDVSGGWKVVMHEQSNQCYYWNTVTGETSWEMPNGLAMETGSTVDGITSLSVNGSVEYHIEGQAHVFADNSMAAYQTVLAAGNSVESSVLSDLGSSQQSNVLLPEHIRTSRDECYASNTEEKFPTALSYEAMDIHSSQLVKYGEDLLQRLKVLGGSFDGLEWIRKEIEIRISDCKALSSYGASLVPFWWHTEIQLKQLDSAISKVESSSFVKSERDGKMEVIDKNKLLGVPGSSPFRDSKTEACNQMPQSKDAKTEDLSYELSDQNLENRKEADDTVPKVEQHVEDVDMDVEMEVDDEIIGQTLPCNISNTECLSALEQVISSSLLSSDCPPAPSGESDIPPPPDEEWIPPPPPPESELVPPPPPPPEEPGLSYPLPYADSVSQPYQDQYNLGYTLPTYEYYAPATSEATNVTYYVQADGSHNLESQPTSYYEPAAAIALPVSIDVTPVESVAYYGFSGGVVPPAPVVSTEYYAAAVAVNYHDSVIPTNTRSVGFSIESESNPVPNAKVEPDISAVYSKPKSDESSTSEAPVASAIQASGTTSQSGSSLAASSSAVPKNQTKVVRSKKRTLAVASTLRSNKKVSSLVDKWKAAKEELHSEEDEEPESTYDTLERKKQKEIEVWRARQIASGEAHDNANFLPLGGDWRERVKRRRAKAKGEAGETSVESVENEKRQPDLAELSKDLPSGWQAYWDESSKEVYYGNNNTSETSWIRPTR
ncbi:uncharacterized protein [Typha latifolia]|uniref:uncharacterized protein isoform X2 n=1 Tax=Typha latifolia TaxID=4733 RepID=UPI003C2FA948